MNFRSLLAVTLSASTLAVHAANIDVVTNGDFNGCTLTGWTTFVTANGTNGAGFPAANSFDVTGGGATCAAEFEVGQVTFGGPPGGGGIEQNVTTGGGSATVHVDFAAIQRFSSDNAEAGIFSVLFDGLTIATRDFGQISGNGTQVLRGAFNQTFAVTPGNHLLAVEITRPFISGPNATPFEYLDNISLLAPAAASVPEPGMLALLGIGLVGFAASRRRKPS